MQLSNFITLSALATIGLAVRVSYDTGYDIPGRSLAQVACSNGEHGLITQFGWQKQSDIPKFPFIGGAQAVAAWNSPSCGTCWRLDYDGRNIYVLAIDHTDSGFNIGLKALDTLTHGRAVDVGSVDAKATLVAGSNCGISG